MARDGAVVLVDSCRVALRRRRDGLHRGLQGRTHPETEAQFLVEHMKESLRGLQPTIDSFEYYNRKLEDENRRLAEEESDLDDRLAALGIIVQVSTPF